MSSLSRNNIGTCNNGVWSKQPLFNNASAPCTENSKVLLHIVYWIAINIRS